ncbi:alpha/beta-hydrolase fold family protein [Metarhizium robertsii]|uniref:Kynurenine formamidase n=2 Tax=Metarhizium robertsii TaxID=568076 RepID=E9EQU1_METRA|nr:alpha/beta-hydrolase [Metarhizium robertsii ARSEF 23]EFZ02597.1 alpha/beta-hydrolase [Metarhizium robertsii ARSEF 23]EXV05805.1 alpha/beta-hydrolase fold family protein [Metarhizium robertsii]
MPMADIHHSWSSTPWERQHHLAVPMLHKSRVPYTRPSNSLQHVHVWVPTKYAPEEPRAPSPSWLPPPDTTLWIIYIHGGAWRDPLETADDLAPTLKSLSPAWLASREAPVAFASVSYSLSPYPQHATHPSAPSDPSRNATHPRHILDVLSAISYLQSAAGFGSNYILAGHSCGATLAFQAVVNPARWGVDPDTAPVQAPQVVLGLNGLYDMPKMVARPGHGYRQHREVYEQFTRGAFGDDERVWRAVSPVYIEDWAREWPGGRHALLVQSREDTLVPFSEAEALEASLLKSKGERLSVELVQGRGDHYDIWRQGTLFAEMLTRAIDVSGL